VIDYGFGGGCDNWSANRGQKQSAKLTCGQAIRSFRFSLRKSFLVRRCNYSGFGYRCKDLSGFLPENKKTIGGASPTLTCQQGGKAMSQGCLTSAEAAHSKNLPVL